jgi:cytoskeletal protein RodZ
MLGEMLRQTREAKGCTLEEVERVTRIRSRFLAALEAEDFAALPSDAQARGFLRNYAEFLGLEAEQVLAHYADSLGKKRRGPWPSLRVERPAASGVPPAARPERVPPRPAPGSHLGRAPQVRSRRPRWLSADVLVGGTITLGLGLLLLWGGSRLAEALQATPAPAAVTGLPVAASDVQVTATPSPVVATPTEALLAPQATYTGVNLVVRAEQRVWLRVVVDGDEVFTGILAPGASKEFVGQGVVELVTSNGLGTRVIWNGQDQGALGELGEVVVRLWTLEGMVVPTPTVTPTPTQTPRP